MAFDLEDAHGAAGPVLLEIVLSTPPESWIWIWPISCDRDRPGSRIVHCVECVGVVLAEMSSGRTGGMLALVEDAAEAVMSVDA